MEGKSVMTVLGFPGDSSDYPLLLLLPARDQGKHVVKQGSVWPDGVPTYKGTWSDLMMHMSPLLAHVLSTGHVEEHIMSTEGTSIPYICMWSQMAHAGNVVLLV